MATSGIVTQADIDSYTNGVLSINNDYRKPAKVGDAYYFNSQIYYSSYNVAPYWITDSVTLVDGNKPFTKVNNAVFRLKYDRQDYENIVNGLMVEVVGHFQTFTINQKDLDAVLNANSKLYVNDVLANNATPIADGDIVKIVADKGYQFYNDERGHLSVNIPRQVLAVSSDMKTISFAAQQLRDSLSFSVSTIPTPIDDIAGVNNVYRIGADLVKKFITRKWIDNSNVGNFKDVNGLIISLLQVPFTIDESLINGTGNIRLGTYDTGEVGEVVIDDKLTINIGSINVSHGANDLTDYNNAKAILNLPYVDAIVLDVDSVIGYKVNVEYILNLYNSMVTVNVYSSKHDDVIISKTIDFNLSVPFGNVEQKPIGSNSNEISFVRDNGIKQAYIEIIKNDVILKNGLFTIPVIDEKILINERGFIKVEEIELKSNASKNEKDDIVNLLNRGVIIK